MHSPRRGGEKQASPPRKYCSAWQALLLCGAVALAVGVTRSLGANKYTCRACSSSLGQLPQTLPMANSMPPILHRPAVLLFGDSLTERSLDPEGGWGAVLAHYLARKVRDGTARSWTTYLQLNASAVGFCKCCLAFLAALTLCHRATYRLMWSTAALGDTTRAGPCRCWNR